MSEKIMTEADQAFYEWFHAHGKSGILLNEQREAFMAGWIAHIEAGQKDV